MIGGLLRCKSLVLGFFLLNGCACFVLFCIISEIFFGLRARELFYYLKGGQVDYGEGGGKRKKGYGFDLHANKTNIPTN